MVSFVSPVFWQIHYLVSSLNKKSFKASVAELNQLIELYGEDARLFLLQCLVQEIDFKDTKLTNPHHKDAFKLQLLSHELTQASTRPNFATLILQAMEGSNRPAEVVNATTGAKDEPAATNRLITEEFLIQFCKLLKLNTPQQLAIAVAIAQSNGPHAPEGIKFLKDRIPDIVGAGIPIQTDVFHQIVSLLKTDEELSSLVNVQELLDCLFSTHAKEITTADGFALTKEEDFVDCLDGDFDDSTKLNLASCLLDSCTFYDGIYDLGYECSSSVQTFEDVLNNLNVTQENTTPNDLAGMLVMLTKPRDQKNQQPAILIQNLTSFGETEASSFTATGWDLDVIGQVIQKRFKSMKWSEVVKGLDRPDLVLYEEKGFQVLVKAFCICAQMDFPVDILTKDWKNKNAQLSILRFAINSDLVSFANCPNKLAPFEGADASSVPRNEAWLSLDLVECLVKLFDSELHYKVRPIFDSAKHACPDILVACLARISTGWSGARIELFGEIFQTYLQVRSNAPAMFRYLWSIDPKLVLHSTVQVFGKSNANTFLRIFALYRHTSDALQKVLASKYYLFALSLAITAANHDLLNIENWVRERLSSQKAPFASATLFYLRNAYGNAKPKKNITPETSSIISFETLGALLKCLIQASSMFPAQLGMELKEVYAACMKAFPGLSSTINPSTQSPAPTSNASIPAPAAPSPAKTGLSSEEIEEQANLYFQQIYTSEQSLDQVIEMLKRFKNSNNEVERNIFMCMIHNLFDEYRFFNKYPDTELRITGILFGRLIQHQLIVQMTLSLALRYVLDALKKPATSKLFRFGVFALEQFMSRLPEMPQYCSHLAQVAGLRQQCPELIQKVDKIIRDSGGRVENNSTQSGDSAPSVATDLATSNSVANTPVRDSASPTLASAASPLSKAQLQIPKSLVAQQSTPPASMSVDGIFGDKSLEPTSDMDAPPENIQDRYHFVINNVSISNLESKIMEMKEFIQEEHFRWLANYLVLKRISTQPNYHQVYLILIEKLNFKALEMQIFYRSLQNVRKLITSTTITTNSQERSLLKNLGIWIGLFTVARNKPLLQRDMDLKELLYVGYETGHLIAVTAFVSKILDGCKKSKIFKPPNPWVMGLLYAMREIYDVPDLKLNIKFEIEVLCKTLHLKVGDLREESVLPTRKIPPRTCNPDFNVKSAPKMPSSPSTPASTTPSASTPTESKKSPSVNSNGIPIGQFPASFQETTVIPNLASYVSTNPSLVLFQRYPNLKRAVPVAVDRAIREIIQPVVERSVTIACITSRELIVKDFAVEGDETIMRKAAHLMVSNLAGSLALVTCKEPLRVSMSNHLRQLITSSVPDQKEEVEQIVQVCSQENLELACMLIEKAATEKAMRDIDEALAASYTSRRRHREQSTQPFFDVAVISGVNSYPAALPEVFRPKPGGLAQHQLMVYEAYQRMPRQPVVPPSSRSSTATTPTTPTSTSSMPISASKPASSPGSLSNPVRAVELLSNLLGGFERVVRGIANSGRKVPRLSSLPGNHEIFTGVQEVQSIAFSCDTASKNDVCMALAQRIFKRMYDLGGRGDELYLEILILCLEKIVDIGRFLRKEILKWVLHAQVDDKLKLHCEILISLIRSKIVQLRDVDMYMARNMGTTNALEFAAHVIRQCLTMEHVVVAIEIPHTIESLERLVQRHGQNNPGARGVINLIDMVKKNFKQHQESGSASGGDAKANADVPGASPSPSSSPVQSGSATSASTFRLTVSNALEHWLNVYKESPGNEKVYLQYMTLLKQYGVMKDEESMLMFFRVGTELCVESCLKRTAAANSSIPPSSGNSLQPDNFLPNGSKSKPKLDYGVLDAYSKLIVLLVKYADPNANVKLNILNKALQAISSVLARAYEQQTRATSGSPQFDQRVYYRLFMDLMLDLTSPDPTVDAINFQILTTFANAFNNLHPLIFPGFAFAWMELISHRSFLPPLLLSKQQRGWPIIHRLLMSLLMFLEPFLRTVVMSASIRTIYRGTLRIMLVLLHDFSEFLCDYHTSFCNVLPPTCVQIRNLILSAFPRSMRLPDPLTPGLQISLVPDILKSPRLAPNCFNVLVHNNLKQDLTTFMKSHQPANFLQDLEKRLVLQANEATRSGYRYNVPVLNAVVLFIGTSAIAQLQAKTAALSSANAGSNAASGNGPNDEKLLATYAANADEIFHKGPVMEIFKQLGADMDAEGRYLLFCAIANHLRYPNSHTHYFKSVLLYLFSTGNDLVKEQITRVILERLIAHRPHPWGLLITFIELIRNKAYDFWNQKFIECCPEIKMVFDDVARSCMGPNVGSNGSATTSAGRSGANDKA